MPKKQFDLFIAEPKDPFRNSLLRRSLAENPKLTQPQIYSRRMPAVTVSRQQQLMPICTARVALHLHTEFILCRAPYEFAARFRPGCISHRLLLQEAAIPDEMRQ